MRYTLLALIALCLVAFAPPKPHVKKLGASFRIAPDSTVLVDVSVTVTGKLRSTDRIRYNFFKDGTLVASRDEAGTSVAGQTMAAPAYGQTSDYWVTVRLVENGVVSPASVKSNVWTYTRPALPDPAPVIDSVRITPATVSLAPGGSVQFASVVS